MTAGAGGGAGIRVALHVGQLLQRVPGGIGRYTGLLARELERAGVEVVAFAAGPRPAGLTAGTYLDLGRPRGALRYALWHWLRHPVVAVDTDLVHAPSLAVPPCSGRPLVVTVHDLAFLRLPQYFTVHGIRFHERGLTLARAEAAAVITPSRFVADELAAEGFAPGRVHVAPHGIDPVPERPEAELEAGLSRAGVRRPFLLTVGTLEPRKGIDTLVAAFARVRRHHPELSLVLAGARGWGRLPRLDRPGVVQVGSVDDDDLDVLYRAATMLVYPSHYEGFGLPLLEAMARGCPVVASSATSLPEVAGEAAHLVPPGDPTALADAVEEVLADPGLREDLVAAGRARVAQFTWANSVAAHLEAYRAALG